MISKIILMIYTFICLGVTALENLALKINYFKIYDWGFNQKHMFINIIIIIFFYNIILILFIIIKYFIISFRS